MNRRTPCHDGNLADLLASANVVAMARAEVALPRTISSRRMTFAGLKKCKPMMSPARALPRAIASMSSVDVLVARIAPGRQNSSRLREDSLLHVDALEHRLDHEVGAGCRGKSVPKLIRPMRAATSVSRTGPWRRGRVVLLDGARPRWRTSGATSISGPRGRRWQAHRDAGSHRARADHETVRIAATSVVAGTSGFGRFAFGEEDVNAGLRLFRNEQFEKQFPLALHAGFEGQLRRGLGRNPGSAAPRGCRALLARSARACRKTPPGRRFIDSRA